MKEITKYKCEYCGTVYDAMKDCQECEEGHHIPQTITGFMYNHISSGYPDRIVVRMSNGASISYVKG